jgi:hypothetical protein
MIAKVPVPIVYGLFAAGALLATYPVWSLWLLGFNPTIDQLLRIRCF